jgi:hypothetical protein
LYEYQKKGVAEKAWKLLKTKDGHEGVLEKETGLQG